MNNPTVSPNRCTTCQRRIYRDHDRYLIRSRHVVCIQCMERRVRKVHALAAPGCAIPRCDVWAHGEDFLSGPRDAVAQLLRQHEEGGPVYSTRSSR